MATNIPATTLVPGVYVTVDNSLANTSLGGTFKTIVIGQKTAAGTATAETLTRVFSAAEAKELAGVGSNLAEMFDSGWFANNTINEVYMIALDDAAASTAAASTLTVTATTAQAGTLFMYVNGKLVRVGVTASQTATEIGDSIEAAINADVDLPYTASNTTGTVTVTAKNKGTLGNQIDTRFNIEADESFPSGVSVAVASSVTGATDPDIADAIAAIPDEVYKLIVNPYTDTANLTALTTELDRRWGNTVQLDGHAIQAYEGTSSAVATFGDTLNSEHLTVMDAGKDTVDPAYVWAAATGAIMAGNLSVDPARPTRSLELVGIRGDVESNRRNYTEKDVLLNAGISTHLVQNDGSVVVDRLVTTYKKNSVGAEDTSYQNTNTMFNLSFLRQSFITRMLSRFPQHKLAEDGTVFGAGQPIATPSVVKTATIALYEEWIALGLVQDVDTFADSLTAEIDSVNRSRINMTMQPYLVGQFYQLDNTLQFIV